MKICKSEGCGSSKIHARGFCAKHYTRLRKRKFVFNDDGSVPGLDDNLSLRERLMHYTSKDENGCWIWQGAINTQGYGHMSYKGRLGLASRWSYEVFVQEIPPKMNVLHKCDVPKCINPNHLFLGSQLDNVRDAIAKGRMVYRKGEGHPNSMINDDIAKNIINKLASGLDATSIAKHLDISRHIVYSIKYGKAWQHIQREKV